MYMIPRHSRSWEANGKEPSVTKGMFMFSIRSEEGIFIFLGGKSDLGFTVR